MLSLIRHSKHSAILETALTAIAIAAALYSACPSAFADKEHGGGPGNGGDAVLINGKWTLLDLAEAGIGRSKPYEKALAEYRKYGWQKEWFRIYIGRTLTDPRFTPAMKDELAAMFEESGLEKAALVAVFGSYSWDLVDAPLAQVGDEQSTLDLSKLKVVQLAIRRDNRIQIDSRAFAKLDTQNQVALFLHEIAYALTMPRKASDGTFYQPSWQARSYVVSRFRSRYAPTVEMAAQEYSPGEYVFEGTNEIREVVSTGYGVASGDPMIVLSKQALYEPMVTGFGRKFESFPTVIDAGNKNTKCPDCWIEDIEISNHNVARETDRMRFKAEQAGKYCGSVPGNTIYAYRVQRVFSVKMVALETVDGRTMRPHIEVIPDTRAAGLTEISFSSLADCQEKVDAFYRESANLIQKSQLDELRRVFKSDRL